MSDEPTMSRERELRIQIRISKALSNLYLRRAALLYQPQMNERAMEINDATIRVLQELICDVSSVITYDHDAGQIK